ncbi:liver-expressed antimicrobial peptide 2 [Hippocampus comes]|uniref:liver-expressed antimicrobial peptide 2 n=1 Tax=Hippocampus comes TaxID=109280 RepID=UPI00094EB1EA|nr:PREDICTED: liver-expressed antimicrobial peptide 2-like [Hippocampus comes]
MQAEGKIPLRRHSLYLLMLLLLMILSQQVCSGPLASPVQSPYSAHKRIARMSPLWRIMNSKPFGAFCQNNYECSTGLCRAGHCSTHQRPTSEPLKD